MTDDLHQSLMTQAAGIQVRMKNAAMAAGRIGDIETDLEQKASKRIEHLHKRITAEGLGVHPNLENEYLKLIGQKRELQTIFALSAIQRRELPQPDDAMAKAAGPWDESKHRRDEHGKFSAQGAGAGQGRIALPNGLGHWTPHVTVGGQPTPVKFAPLTDQDLSAIYRWDDEHLRLHMAGNVKPWTNIATGHVAWPSFWDDVKKHGSIIEGLQADDAKNPRLLGMYLARPLKDSPADAKPWLYLELLQSSPDGLRPDTDPKQVRGVGLALLTKAVARSLDPEFSGKSQWKPYDDASFLFYEHLAKKYGGIIVDPKRYELRLDRQGAHTFLANVARKGKA